MLFTRDQAREFEKYLDSHLLQKISIPLDTSAILKLKNSAEINSKLDPTQLAKELPTHLLLESSLIKTNQ